MGGEEINSIKKHQVLHFQRKMEKQEQNFYNSNEDLMTRKKNQALLVSFFGANFCLKLLL